MRTGIFTRYLIPLVLLVAIIGGIAWLAQYLPRWTRPAAKPPVEQVEARIVTFSRPLVRWVKTESSAPDKKDAVVFRDVEKGKEGFYDFLFKNVSGEDVEAMFYITDCDCASVEATSLDLETWTALDKQQAELPGEPLVYAPSPVWKTLVKHAEWTKLSAAEKEQSAVLIKAGQGGVVRVHWRAVKSAGQSINVRPGVGFQVKGDESRGIQWKLIVPVALAPPVRFFPPRIDVGTLGDGGSTPQDLYAYSTTREQLDLQLTPNPDDGLIEISATPLPHGIFSRGPISELQWKLKLDAAKGGKTQDEAIAKALSLPNPPVLSAYRVTIKVQPAKGDKQLDLGSFYRRLEVGLDGFPMRDQLAGPEVVGRVRGVVRIGGEGKVRIRSFSVKEGGSGSVNLATKPDVKLEPAHHRPDWINVDLGPEKSESTAEETIWRLTVTVPENTPAARSFEEPDAVVLRIVGPTERLVRIPIEGHISGR